MYPPIFTSLHPPLLKRVSDPVNGLHGHLFRKGLTVLEKIIDPRER